MKLSRLLELHTKSNPHGSLAESFGDGFLCERNQIFKNIRQRALDSGYLFSKEFDSSYNALPLSQLDQVLARKTIPYADNVSVLKEINQKTPDRIDWDHVTDNLKRNAVFHEAAHAVARTQSAEYFVSVDKFTNLEDQRLRTLHILLEESFANACELLSIVDAEDQAHRIYLELNSYVYMLPTRVHLTNAIREIGFQPLAKFLILTYLHANFLFESLNDRNFEMSAQMAQIDRHHFKNLRALSKVCFELNPRFRTVTTSLYLRLNGIFSPTEELFDFDFLQNLIDVKNVDKLLNLLVNIPLTL